MKFKMIHENYNVSDLERSMRFYEEALGLKEARRKTGDDYIIVYLSNAEAEFELELTWLKDHPQKYDLGEEEFHLAFRTDDFEAAHALHEKMGCICFENGGVFACYSFSRRVLKETVRGVGMASN